MVDALEAGRSGRGVFLLREHRRTGSEGSKVVVKADREDVDIGAG